MEGHKFSGPSLKICSSSDEDEEPSKITSNLVPFVPTLQSLQSSTIPLQSHRQTPPFYRPLSNNWTECHICAEKFQNYDQLYEHMYVHDPCKPNFLTISQRVSSKCSIDYPKTGPKNVYPFDQNRRSFQEIQTVLSTERNLVFKNQ